MAAKADFDNLNEADAAKVLALFQRLAESGKIFNRDKFKSLGRKGSSLWEFKSFQDRFLGNFRPGQRFLIAAYEKKQKDRLDPEVVKRAVNVLAANDRYESQTRIEK